MDSNTIPTLQPFPLTELRPGDLALHVVSPRTGRAVMRGWDGKQWGDAFLPLSPDHWEDLLDTWAELAGVGQGLSTELSMRLFRHLQGYTYLGYGLNAYNLPDIYYRPISHQKAQPACPSV